MPESPDYTATRLLFYEHEFPDTVPSDVHDLVGQYVSMFLVDRMALQKHVASLVEHRSPVTSGADLETVATVVHDGVINLPIAVLVSFSRRPDLLAVAHEQIWEVLPEIWIDVIENVGSALRSGSDISASGQLLNASNDQLDQEAFKTDSSDIVSFSRTMSCSAKDCESVSSEQTCDSDRLIVELTSDEYRARVLSRSGQSTLLLDGTFATNPEFLVTEKRRIPVIEVDGTWRIQGHPRLVAQHLRSSSRCELRFSSGAPHEVEHR